MKTSHIIKAAYPVLYKIMTPKIFLQFVSLYCYSIITITPGYFTRNKTSLKEKLYIWVPLAALFFLLFEIELLVSILIGPHKSRTQPSLIPPLPVTACPFPMESFCLCSSAVSSLRWEGYLPCFTELMFETHSGLENTGASRYWWHCCSYKVFFNHCPFWSQSV